MAIVRPFKGVRPIKEKISEIASPPYDVINSSEAREYVKSKPLSFLRVVKPEIDLPENIDIYDERVYQKGRENLDKLINDGNMIIENDNVFYIYQQIMGNHKQTGIVACASVDDYINDIIKKHEHTREDKENDRAKHVETLNANTGPVFLTYKSNNEIKSLINDFIANNAPEYDFSDELNVRHIFYIIKNEDTITKLKNLFEEIEYLYVADGHHRSAAAVRVAKKMREKGNYTGEEEFNFFLSVIFPDDEMMIMDYNRAVKDLNGFSQEEFFNKIKENFDIEEKDEKYKPENVHTCGMYINNKWYKLSAKENLVNTSDPVKSLDVYIMQEFLLKPILGIENPRKDNRISFIGGIRGLEELEKLVNSNEYKVAFAMFPTSIKQLMNVADSGQVMPPKSTWFEPKLRSGIVIHRLS